MIIIKIISAGRLRKDIKDKILSCGYSLHDKNAHWFVAYENKKYTGFGGLWKLNGLVAYMGPTFVKEQFRGKGIHRRLIEARLEFAKNLNVDIVWSRAEMDNIASARNLIRCGFNLDKPRVVGMMGDGRFTVCLDDSEIMAASPTELFFSINL